MLNSIINNVTIAFNELVNHCIYFANQMTDSEKIYFCLGVAIMVVIFCIMHTIIRSITSVVKSIKEIKRLRKEKRTQKPKRFVRCN